MSVETNVNFANLTPVYPSNPSNIYNGVSRGVGNVMLGTAVSVGLLVAGPVKGAVDGYEKFGVAGAVTGTVLGGVVGTLGAALVVTGGACVCIWQSLVGLLRTPTYLYSVAQGKQWDEDTQEWIHYDMSKEVEKIGSMTDEEFCNKVKEKGGAFEVFSLGNGTSTMILDATDSVDPEIPRQKAPEVRKKKNVLDRELYDILGVEPEATASEIKKAYYVKARQNHPDRNGGDEKAKAAFQLIGQAYQVLADERSRAAYDSKGKSSIESKQTMDAGTLYSLIFGTEAFESIIGELNLATQVKIMLDPTTRPSEIFRFRQRKRELQLAQVLVAKLDVYVDGDEQLFREKCRKEADELSESPLGCTLLGVIGNVYMQKASAKMNAFFAFTNQMTKIGTSIVDSWNFISYGFMAAVSAMEMKSLHAEAEAKQKAEDEANNITPAQRKEMDKANGPVNMNALYGPNPTPEFKVKVRQQTKHMTGHIFGLLWQMTKSDIESTVKHVCRKVLTDTSVTATTIEKRAAALYILGEEYAKKVVADKVGLEDFLERMGTQTGLFGKEPTAKETENPMNEEHKQPEATSSTDNPNRLLTKVETMELISKVDSMTVKELKSNILRMQGDITDCVEKSDLKAKLNDLLAERMYQLEEELPF